MPASWNIFWCVFGYFVTLRNMYNFTRAHGEPAGRVFLGFALSLLVLWTLLGNFTVCAAVLRFRHLRGKVTNIFIVSLAMSDLLVAVLVMPWRAATEVTGHWAFGSFCQCWVAFDIMCSTASILNLCVISLIDMGNFKPVSIREEDEP